MVAIRITGRAVEATPVREPMEIRTGVATGNGEQHAAAARKRARLGWVWSAMKSAIRAVSRRDRRMLARARPRSRR